MIYTRCLHAPTLGSAWAPEQNTGSKKGEAAESLHPCHAQSHQVLTPDQLPQEQQHSTSDQLPQEQQHSSGLQMFAALGSAGK